MAQATGTYSSYDARGIREDLQDVIYNISPTDVPYTMNVGTVSVQNTHHEWQTDVLAAASTSNAFVSGDEFTYVAPTPTVRPGNYTQISRKTFIITRTLEAVRKAGRKSEVAYQLAKQGKELKRDIEAILLNNQGSVAGDDTTPRTAAGLPAWLTTNVSRGVGGANGGFQVGTGLVTAATDGTQRAFDAATGEGLLKDVFQDAYTAGGEPTILMVGPFNKRQFSSWPGIADLRRDVPGRGQATIVGAADFYIGDYGNLAVVTNRFQRERDAFLIDPEYSGVGWLRRMQHVEPAITGDAEKHVIICEWTHVVKNEAAHGVIADLTTTA